MNRIEIKRRYEQLLKSGNLNNIYDGRGTTDIYFCAHCYKMIFTTYKDLGVTPFIIKCECGSDMKHIRTYNNILKDAKIENWVRPSLEQAYKMNDGMLEHLFNGGLFLESELKELDKQTTEKGGEA